MEPYQVVLFLIGYAAGTCIGNLLVLALFGGICLYMHNRLLGVD